MLGADFRPQFVVVNFGRHFAFPRELLGQRRLLLFPRWGAEHGELVESFLVQGLLDFLLESTLWILRVAGIPLRERV